MAQGRPIEVKRQIVQGITELMIKAINARPERVIVQIIELPRDSISIAGVLLSEEKKA